MRAERKLHTVRVRAPANEEEVKNQIITPWLRRQGVDPHELSYETSFEVRVGTNLVTVGGDAAEQIKRGRLDVLVHRRGVNLLVIEVKGPDVGLSDTDRDQAVSYAKLVHPIAPFALVTNGKEFRLYDVLTKEPVAAEDARLADGTSIVLPDEARLDALRLFFDWSPENVAAFCRAQVHRVTQQLYGEPSDLSAVYIPETHVAREALTETARTFLASDRPLLVLVGESGMGKSCVMVDIAGALSGAGYPVLFLRGALLASDILDEIATEVDWAYGNQRGSIETLRCLARNCGVKPLVVMVDGIEDLQLPTRVQDLASLASRVRALNVRLVISSKTGSWAEFTSLRGQRTNIHAAIHHATVDRPFSAEVGPFEPREFFKAVERHRSAYGLEGGGFDPTALREAQASPFMLRLLFQVRAAGSLAALPGVSPRVAGTIAFDTRELFETYLRLAASKTGRADVVVGLLLAVAGELHDLDEEWIDEQRLRSVLAIPATEPIPPELFEQRLLIGVGPLGLRRISFGFGLLRSYLIAVRVRRLSERAPAEFAREASEARPGGPRAEALVFYYSFATNEQKRELDKPVWAHAHDYLKHYITLIDEFPALRDSFAPFTQGSIGFAGNLRFPPRVGMYGFRAIGPGDEAVLLAPIDSAHEHVTRLFVAGVERAHYHSRVDGFRNPISVDLVCDTEVVDQLEQLAKHERLNEGAASELAEELIACIVKSFDCFTEFLDPKTKNVLYPIDLGAVERALKREYLNRHFSDCEVDAKRARGEIEERWHGSTVSYNATLNPAEWKKVHERTEAALLSGEEIEYKARYVNLEGIKSRLDRTAKALRANGVVLSGPVLPVRAALVETLRRGGVPAPETVKEHCRRVLELALTGYRRTVEFNFPNHANAFGFYSRGPLRAILALDPGFVHGEGHSFLAFCRSRYSDCEVTVCDVADAVLDLETDTVAVADGTYSYISARWPEIGEFLYGRPGTELDLRCDAAVIRKWVYGWIHDHFRSGRTKDWLKAPAEPPPNMAP